MIALSTLHVVAALAGYGILVLVAGFLAMRRSGRSPEEYFLAGRGLGTLVLFMALFGTNTTPFVLVGIPEQSYRFGIGIFSVNAPIVALGIPLTFWAIGVPARRMAARLGALTPAELFAKRFASRGVGAFLVLAFTVTTIPYMVSTVKGAAVTFATLLGADVPSAWVSLGILGVALVYTALGGMRATAWTNVIQGTLFLAFLVGAFFGVAAALDGLPNATGNVAARRPELLTIGEGPFFPPGPWISWSLVISLTVIAFPHMLVRLMAARDEDAMRRISVLYPLALFLLWTPAVFLGVWAAGVDPATLDVERGDEVFARMVTLFLPPWFAAFGLLAILAASMSTLDAQLLTLTSMFQRDVVVLAETPGDQRREVRSSRRLLFALTVVVFALAESWGDSVFEIARFSFTGYVTLVPMLLLALRWRRFDARGAVGSVLAGNAVLLAGHVDLYDPAPFLPVFWALLASFAVALLLPLFGERRLTDAARRAFGDGP